MDTGRGSIRKRSYPYPSDDDIGRQDLSGVGKIRIRNNSIRIRNNSFGCFKGG